MKRVFAMLVAPIIIAAAVFTTTSADACSNCLDYLAGDEKFEQQVTPYLQAKEVSKDSHQTILRVSERAYRATKHAAEEAFRQAIALADKRFLQAKKDIASAHQTAEREAREAFEQRRAAVRASASRARANARRIYKQARDDAQREYDTLITQRLNYDRQFYEHFGRFKGRRKFGLRIHNYPKDSLIIPEHIVTNGQLKSAMEADIKKANREKNNAYKAARREQDINLRQAQVMLGRNLERADSDRKNRLEAIEYAYTEDLKLARTDRQNALGDAETDQDARNKAVDSARAAAERAAEAYRAAYEKARVTLGDAYIKTYANPNGFRRDVAGHSRGDILKVAVHERVKYCPKMLNKQPEPR